MVPYALRNGIISLYGLPVFRLHKCSPQPWQHLLADADALLDVRKPEKYATPAALQSVLPSGESANGVAILP